MKTDALQDPLSEINVTPFVDVMLVLLIIFMVTAPLMQKGFNVALPPAVTGKRVSNAELVITLTKEHMVYLNDDVVTLRELRQKLTGMAAHPVFIRADRSAYVSRLIELWDLCRDMGIATIHVATSSD
jgi:biopolymer transport protein ExbD